MSNDGRRTWSIPAVSYHRLTATTFRLLANNGTVSSFCARWVRRSSSSCRTKAATWGMASSWLGSVYKVLNGMSFSLYTFVNAGADTLRNVLDGGVVGTEWGCGATVDWCCN